MLAWLFLYFWKKDATDDYLKKPAIGHVYIFHYDNLYEPMRLDSISSNQLFMRNYLFQFTDAIPERDQILANEFDLNFYAIYEKDEIFRLRKAGQLVKIYP